MKPTPRPWNYFTYKNGAMRIETVEAKKGTPVTLAEVPGNYLEARANAAHMVKCVNIHEELVELLSEVYDRFGDDDPLMHRVANALSKAEAL